MYGQVKTIDFYGEYAREDITTENALIEHIGKRKNACEIIGEVGQKIKPIFDFDSNEPINLEEMTTKINKVFPNKKVNYAVREPRLKKGKMRYSARGYVDGVMIKACNLAELVKNADFKEPDASIYSLNRKMFLPLTTRKEYNVVVPQLKLLNGASLFDCCSSYIKEDFEDWDERVEELIRGKNILAMIEKECSKNDVIDKSEVLKEPETLLKTYLDRLNAKRFEDYESWIHCMFAIIHVGFKNNIVKNKTRGLVHHYSSLAENYSEDDVDKWFDATYDKQKDKNGYGIPYILKCVREDDKEWYDINIGMTYDNIKKGFDKRVFKCNDPIGFVEINTKQNELNPVPYYIYKRGEVIDKYEDLCYYEKDEKGKVSKKSFMPRWLKDPTKKLYHNVVFIPKKLSPELANNHFNMFKGFRAEKLPVVKNYDLIKPFLDHIFIVLSKSRPDVYNFIIQWFAQIIRNPSVKTQVFIIFKSEQGSGKNIILDMIGKKIIGDYAVDTAQPENVFFGNFNSLMCNKVFIVCNEAGNGLRDCVDRIKDVITAPTINIEKKGKDPIVFANNVNAIGTTNNRAPFPIPPDDRRITLFECSMEKKGNAEYFERLGDLCENDEAISSFYHYLLEEVKITIKNFQKDRPITEEYKKVQQLHIPNCVSYMIDIGDTLNWKNYNERTVCLLKINDLYRNYKTYCESCKITPYSKKNFIFDIVCERSGILKCIFHGHECIRLLKPKYEAWIEQYKSLECEMDLENYDDFDLSGEDIE